MHTNSTERDEIAKILTEFKVRIKKKGYLFYYDNKLIMCFFS